MESINGLYKAECIRTTVFHDGPYKTMSDVEYATAGWVDWYDNRRLHSTLGEVPSLEHELAHNGREPGALRVTVTTILQMPTLRLSLRHPVCMTGLVTALGAWAALSVPVALGLARLLSRSPSSDGRPRLRAVSTKPQVPARRSDLAIASPRKGDRVSA